MPRDLKTAQAELDEARATLATLEEQVREGDDVTPQQLSGQRELIAFAELRVEAAERTETRLQEEERAALATKAKAAAESLIAGEGIDAIAEATRVAADALSSLAALAYQRNARIAEVGSSIEQVRDQLEVAGAAPPTPLDMRQYGVWGGRDHVVVGGVGRVSKLNVGTLAMAVVVAGLGGHLEGREAQANLMHEFNGLRDQAVGNLLVAYPELGEVLRVQREHWEAADERERALISTQRRRPHPRQAVSA